MKCNTFAKLLWYDHISFLIFGGFIRSAYYVAKTHGGGIDTLETDFLNGVGLRTPRVTTSLRESGDIKYLICHVTSQNHLTEVSSNFMSGRSSWCVNILPSLVAIGTVVVEIWYFLFAT